MVKGVITLLLMLVLVTTFISGAPPVQTNVNIDSGLQIFYPSITTIQQNIPYNLHIRVNNISNGKELINTQYNCSLHLYNQTGSHLITQNFTKNSNNVDMQLYIKEGNFSTLGELPFKIYCFTPNLGGSVSGIVTVTPTGMDISPPVIIFAYVILLLFFSSLILLINYITSRINYEKWYKSILKKYEDRNTIKVIISSIGYNFMKNKFIWYYLIGLPIILLLTDMTHTFGVSSMLDLMKIILAVYWYGFLLVGVFFFGFLQEWVKQISDEIKNGDYGV